mmetsp:Transcript_101238/g.151668  ORF Transcript_101238/g.151668 Transcript_101238/m.151668 type:complete len:408 (-) Transcript_101238:79-1302(-)
MNTNRSTSPQNVTDVCDIGDHMLGKLFPVMADRLSFTMHRDEEHTKLCIKHDKKKFYFSSWMHEAYESFCSDFGPVDLAATVRFCDMLKERLDDPRLKGRHLVYYCDAHAAYFTNLVYLLGAYLVLVEGWSPEQAANQFANIDSSMVRPFRDSTRSKSTFDLTLLDCFRGLQRAVQSGFFKYDQFDVEKYELLHDPCFADLSLICDKFIAFRGPSSSAHRASQDMNSAARKLSDWALPPSAYIPLFKQLGVSTVVRLNNKETYNNDEFRKEDFAHHDLFFEDCSVPTLELLKQFHALCDAAHGRVAVHCLAGLGRTGTMIATYIMRDHQWSAREAIAWLRIVRPGSIMGPQQHFLEEYEMMLQTQRQNDSRSSSPFSAASSSSSLDCDVSSLRLHRKRSAEELSAGM